MPPSHRQKTKSKPAARKPAAPRKPAPATKKSVAKATRSNATTSGGSARKGGAAPKVTAPPLELPRPDGRRHLLSLSFVRDGDEFLARLETDSGHITELKNRSLDQLLTLVASELEDLLE